MATVEAIKNRRDIDLIKTVLKQNNIRHYLLFLIGINTGLRISDLLQLKVSDFIATGKKTTPKHLIIKEKKTGKTRKIAINPSIEKGIKLFCAQYNPETTDYLFISRKGIDKPISCTQAYRILQDVANICKIDVHVGTHSMRKTWGYFTYIGTGNNLGLVMKMLNHTNPAVTLRYIGIDQAQQDDAYLMLEI